ncbi:MAG: hypothetical protein FWD84_06110 [Oscillospiraceae bacterium]|nr:hypothetical protein [Oscillospiraceae bacterium]
MNTLSTFGRSVHTDKNLSLNIATDQVLAPTLSEPSFDNVRKGYSVHQVDDYISKLRAENEEVAGANSQLLQLWLADIPALLSTQTGASAENPSHVWAQLVRLLERSLDYNAQRPTYAAQAERVARWGDTSPRIKSAVRVRFSMPRAE